MTSAPPPSRPSSGVAGDGAVAFRNALKLGTSLVLTWTVALIVRFKLPNYLGKDAFGEYTFADGFAATLFVFIGLGIDTYIQREISVRPKHASDFFLGTMLTRVVLCVPLFLFSVLFLWAKGKPSYVQWAALLFGVTQIFVTLNATFSAMIQASTRVGGLAVVNVVSKILWGGGVLLCVRMQAPFVLLAVPMLASEAFKMIFLFRTAKEAVNLEIRFDKEATRAVLRESFPFFVSAAAVALGSRLDVTMLDSLAPSKEVGWYGSASNIGSLAMLLSPLLSWVLMPLMTRAKHRSEDEFFAILRRVIEGVTVVSLPVTLLLALGADVWIRLAFRPEFAPAAISLRYFAPIFVFTYGTVILWLALMILGRSWTITLISIGGLLSVPILILAIVPLTAPLGDGYAGMGVSLALSIRECGLVIAFLYFLGRRAIDARVVTQIGKSLVACGIVVAAHVGLARFGDIRLAAEAGIYFLLMFALGIVRPSDIRRMLKMLRSRGNAT